VIERGIEWTDEAWQGVALSELVLRAARRHVLDEGTFDGA
jgi:hypothetical protein